METPTSPLGPWYLVDQQQITTGRNEGLCDTCCQLDFEWLLSNDLAFYRSRGEQGAKPHKSDFCLPFGTLSTILRRSSTCPFCGLVIRSFRASFEVESLFQGAQHLKAIENKNILSRKEYGGLCNVTIEKHESTFLIGVKTRAPSLMEVNASDAWLEIDNSPPTWGKFVFPSSRPYGIRVWLCTGINGRPVKHLVFNRIVVDPDPLYGRIISSDINMKTIKKWLDLSISQSNEHVVELPKEVRSYFRLIDVFEECLTPMDKPCSYAALSYVWGQDDSSAWLQNTISNMKVLHQPGGISINDKRLQATLRDAMALVKETGTRYIWIDKLCITQDDQVGKMTQISYMDCIYKGAVFTIVAASESDANTGLPGMSLSRPKCQCLAVVRGLEIGSRPPQSSISNLPWSRRGWTFQEGLMSPRKLIFTPNRVYLEDLTGYYEEDVFELSIGLITDLQTTTLSMKGRGIGAMDYYYGDNDLFKRYCGIVNNYTTRELSLKSDILNAFAGVSRALGQEFEAEILFGLPVNSTSASLLWLPTSPIKRRTDTGSVMGLCPSWTWAGWEGGAVRYDFRDPKYFNRIVFLEQKPQSLTRAQLPGLLREDSNSVVLREISSENVLISQNPVLRLSVLCTPFMLCAERIRLRDFMGAKKEYRGLQLYALEDGEGNFSGAVCIHDYFADPEYKLGHYIGPFDLIAVARSGHGESDQPPPPDDSDIRTVASQPQTNDLRPLDKDIREEHHTWLAGLSGAFPGLTTEDPYFYTSSSKRFYNTENPWNIYDVLVVQQRGEYAYRIGVGRCYAEAFWRNGAVRKEIFLS